jgi:phosphohistidine phosphatase
VPSTRQLYVLRHAKSSWEEPGQDDHDRPLAPRGRRALTALRRHVREGGIRPELVLCSPARRTRETLEGVDPGGEVLIEEGLYTASGAQVLERLRQVPDEVRSVMVVGHNPAMQALVLRLAGTDSHRASDALDTAGGYPNLGAVQRKFPTGALATLSFQGPWSELEPGCARLSGLVRPKDLR